MDPQSVAECKQRWDTDGWCVIADVIPADLLAAAQAALPSVFPTADEFADGVDPERNAAFMTERHSPSPTFPFEAEALNRVALHDNVIDLAERMLESADIRLYQDALSAKYANAAPDYEQLLHADYGNHTLVVPRTDVGYQHVTMFVYLSDVTPQTAATRGRVARAHRRHPGGAPLPAPRRLQGRVRGGGTGRGPRGLGLRVPVRRVPPGYGAREAPRRAVQPERRVQARRGRVDRLPHLPGARRRHGVAPVHAHATVRQLTVLGFPAPGDPYWTRETLAGVAARYPALDMSPWRNGSNA